jgi:hypothetical protein
MPVIVNEFKVIVPTLTLPNDFLDMVAAAEELCGPGDQTFRLLAIEFWDCIHPLMKMNGKDLVIGLPKYCLEDRHHAFHQLAHETVHTLRPGNPRRTTNLEEGVAEYFAQEYVAKKLNYPMCVSEKLETARAAVALLLNDSGDSFRNNMREKQPIMSPMDESFLDELNPRPTDNEIRFLIAEF